MKSFLQFRSLILFFLLSFIITGNVFSQDKSFIGIKVLKEGNNSAFQTITQKNNSEPESLNEYLKGISGNSGDKYVLGGNILWSFQDAIAIANTAELNGTGNVAFNAWTLNSMRTSLYNDINANPVWEYSTLPYDPVVDISDNEQVVAFTAGISLHIRDTTGTDYFQLSLPDSLYATNVAVSRDGLNVVFLSTAQGSSTTARAYCINLSGAPAIAWTFDVSANEITNWAGVKFSPSGSKVVLAGRHHMYVLNTSDGSLIWDRFVDNTESPAVLSGDGEVLVTADNSGFIQTWVFNSTANEYNLLWQYRVPSGTSTNWASSVDISADGLTIVAGSLIFLSGGYDGSIMCFDTYGGGTPKWVYTGAGDLVDDVALSDDGKVAAAVTWGDLPHSQPDLYVFDVETGQVAYNVITPGSFFTVDISNDGRRVFAGGKAVHAREFGNGGRIYFVQVDLGGGYVSGTIDLAGTTDDSGVVVRAGGTDRTALTDIDGNYLIKNIPAGLYTISAEKPGYNFGEATNISVTEGDTTSGINFTLSSFAGQPPTLNASTQLVGAIMLNWNTLVRNVQREKEIAKMVGDYYDENFSMLTTQSVKKLTNNIIEKDVLYEFGVDSIAIYKSLASGGPYSKIAAVPSNENSYTDSNVVPLRYYFYVVTLFNDLGESVYSNEALGQVSDTLLTFNLDVPQGTLPTIDGVLSPGEWDDAFQIDITDVFGYGSGSPKPQGSVLMYLKYDDNSDMLYVGGEDLLNTSLDDNEGFGLYFDDNNNNVFDNDLPFIQEGNFWAYWHPGGADLRFRDLTTFEITTLTGAAVAFTDGGGHVQGEVAIPMGFLEGYQLQVFGPDKTPGLGAFLIERLTDQTAVFNGWWPQTMNSLFNPQYFGDVGIDVSLEAPPQAPSDITVTRQGEDLLLTWSDPTLGLNNDPLQSPPTIYVYKNDELLKTFTAGVESYLDTEVYCSGWYEYKLEASIQAGSVVLTGPVSAPAGDFACGEPILSPISYDDDDWDAFYVVDFTWDDNKFAVRFTPQNYPVILRSVETLVNSNDDFNFTVQADNNGLPGDTLAGPYTVASTDAATVGTVTKNLPGTDPPEIREGDFWVLVNWHMDSPGAPGIGVDIDPPNNNRSMFYLASSGWQAATFGNIMITAYVGTEPVGIERETDSELPLTFDLKQNYPNPFNPVTIINYQLPENETVTLEIFNALGEKIRTLVNQTQEAGYYTVEWDGKNNYSNPVSSGMYLYRIKAGNFINVRKMVLLR